MAYVKGELPHKRKEQSQLDIFEYSNSKEYLVTPDVVEYDKNKMTNPVYDLILGCKNMKELGIVLDL